MLVPKRVFVALAAAGAMAPATSAARINNAAPRHHCTSTYTRPMFIRAVQATYQGTHEPRHGAYGRLWRYARCGRHGPRGYPLRWARAVWGIGVGRWEYRRQQAYAADHPYSSGVASWYDDSGSTASGWHSYYGFATCGSGGGPCLAFGTKVQFCYGGRCVVAVADDHGPYVGGRDFDVNQNVEGVLGFDGVATVAWRIVG